MTKFLELNGVMWTTNLGLNAPHAYESRPKSWPILRRGIVSDGFLDLAFVFRYHGFDKSTRNTVLGHDSYRTSGCKTINKCIWSETQSFGGAVR